MATIDQIITTVEGLPIADDGSLTLAATDFAGIDVVGSFFTAIAGAPSYRLAEAKRTPGTGTITVAGTADVLGYPGLTAQVTFATITADQQENPVGEGVTVTLTGTRAEQTPTPLPIVSWIKVDSVSVAATVTEPYDAVTYGFTASIVLSGASAGTVPISLRQLDGRLWMVELAGEAGHSVTLAQVVDLLGGHALEQFLPAALVNLLTGLAVDDLAITFDPASKTVTQVRLALTVTNGWPAAPGLALDPGLHLLLTVSNPGDDATRDFLAVVTGQLEIAGTKVPVFVQVDVAGGTSTWLVGLDPATEGVTLPSLSGLFTLAGGQGFTNSLPAGLAQLPAIQINPLLIGFTLNPAALQRVSFGATTVTPWPVIDGFLTVQKLSLDLELVGLAGAGKGVGGTLAAIFSITDTVWLYFQVVKDPKTATWTLSGGLPPGHPLNLTDLVAKLLHEYVAIPANAPAFVLDTVDLTVIPGTSMTFTAGSQTPWPLLDALTLDSFTLTFSYTQGAASPFTGSLTTTMTVAKVPLTIIASLGSSGAFSFKGSTEKGVKIEVGNLIADLEQKFGVSVIPAEALQGFTIADIDLEFNAGADPGKPAGFSFGCDGTFFVAGVELDFALAVGLTKATTGYTGTFTGLLDIKKQNSSIEQISVKLVEDKLTADWKASPGHGLSLNDLASCFGFGDLPPIPDAIDLTLTAMTFEYDVPSAGLSISATTASGYKAVFVTANVPGGGTRVRRFAFAVDLPLHVTLSALPLIGRELPDADRVGVPELGCWIVSGNLVGSGTGSDAAALNLLVPVGYPKLPEEAMSAGVLLFGSLQLGDTTVPLQLALGGQQAQPRPQLPQPPVMTAALGDPTPSDGTKWFDVQKTFGPVAFQKIGVRYADNELWFLLTADLSIGGLTISLYGLGVGSPLKDPHPDFTISGLGVTLAEGPVQVSGALLGTLKPINFAGEVVVAFEEFKLAALAGYAEVDAHPSFFGYVVVDVPIGGPPFFFVTGLAGGIGFNRQLLLPHASGVADFPLVKWALGTGDPPSSASGGNVGDRVAKVVASLSEVVAPSVGEYWVAAGVSFTVFKALDCFALVSAKFGTEFEIALLGVATVQVPPAPAPAVAEAQLALEASFAPATGLVAIGGQLTPASFLLVKDCRLTGGFAFWSWVSGEHAGEFVITLGGYSPKFTPPSYYPVVPRLGVSFTLDALQITGGLFYGLTASAVMAGGSLSATWSSGSIKAWFSVEADFLIVFEPFHYFIEVGIQLGASFKLNLLLTTVTITIHLGVDLQIWGPDFSGRATIDLSIVSFTIDFGASGKPKKQTLEWSDFVARLLPHSGAGGATLTAAADDPQPAVVQILVTGGMRKQLDGSDGIDFIADGQRLELLTRSSIPLKTFSTTANLVVTTPGGQPAPATDFGIGPTDTDPTAFQPNHDVQITTTNTDAQFAGTPDLANVATALWQQRKLNEHGVPQHVDPLNGTTIPNAATGVRIAAQLPDPSHAREIDLEWLQYTEDEQHVQPLAWSVSSPPTSDPFTDETVWGTITQAPAAANRTALVGAVAAAGLPVPGAIDVSELATETAFDLLEPPLLRLLGEQR